MRTIRQTLFLLFIALFLNACSLVAQKIHVTPSVITVPLNDGLSQYVKVEVVDGRSSPILGSRGGNKSEDATLTVANDLVSDIKKEIERVLDQWGYRVVQNSEGVIKPIELRLTLKNLSYQGSGSGSYVTNVDVASELKIEVKKHNSSYTRQYTSEATNKVGIAPSQAKNEVYMSDILSVSLTRVFKDESLITFLNRD